MGAFIGPVNTRYDVPVARPTKAQALLLIILRLVEGFASDADRASVEDSYKLNETSPGLELLVIPVFGHRKEWSGEGKRSPGLDAFLKHTLNRRSCRLTLARTSSISSASATGR
jgi:hypothetical protein